MDVFAGMQNQLQVFILILVRVSGLLFGAPVFGSRNVPSYAKIGLALAISYTLFPLLYQDTIEIPDSLFPYLFLVAKELLAGIVLAFASSLVFSAVLMTGQILDMQIGFGIINILDPMSGQQMPLVGNFKNSLALLIFLVTNGHHIFLSAMVASFKLIPITSVVFQSILTDIVIDMVIGMFTIALKISLPVLLALLLTDISLGVLTRTMPQMNIFVVGVPGKIIVGIFVLSLALPFYIQFLGVVFDGMFHDVYRLMAHLR